ncbi:PA14 domain-containing protein [Ilumatobacter sp.]|uniref:PA14 domain-containing protein n=1 Tax=Ilumatobacter sp. TaxID=1967498 RepID=UPI003B516558
MTLVFLTVGSLLVLALLSFASTLFLNRPPLEERSDSLEAVRSAMRMAVTMQRSHGPEGCFDHPSGSFDVNGRSVAIECSVVNQQYEIDSRFSIIATSDVGNAARDGAAIAATGSPKTIENDVFVSGGSLAADTSAISLGTARLVGDAGEAGVRTPYRYTTVDATTDLDAAGTDCATFYGPQVLTKTFAGLELLATTKAPIEVETRASDVQVKVAGHADAEILGAIVTQVGGARHLDRRFHGDHIDTTSSITGTSVGITAVTACYQVVGPDDPAHVPRDLTTCGSPLMDPERFDQSPSTDGVTCADEPWWTNAGWSAAATADHVYPMLPRIPTYARSSTPLEVGSSGCHVFYPGRYDDDLELDGGRDYYFASGIYLFSGTVEITGDARVVGGEGIWEGCTFDAEASFLPGSPRNHEITGDGVTFLLGGDGRGSDGRIEVANASLRLNQRIATTSTRASAGMNVMTVNAKSPEPTAGTTLDVEIPFDDRVLLPGCLGSEVAAKPSCAEGISTYRSIPVAGATPLVYVPSTLGHDELALDVDLDGSSRTRNRVLFGGAVFTPNAAVSFARTGGGSEYQVSLAGGVTATTIELDFADGAPDQVVVGEDAATTYLQVELTATTDFDGREFTSAVLLEVDDAARYAINSWVVGSVESGAVATTSPATTAAPTTTVAPTTTPLTTVPTTAPATSTSSTTVPPTSTSSTTVPPTTVPPSTVPPSTVPPTIAPPTTAPPTTAPPTTAPPTTAPPTTAPPTTSTPPVGFPSCRSTPNHTKAFGPGTWQVSHWTNPTLSGAPAAATTESEVDVDFKKGANPAIGVKDDFSMRWTQSLRVTESCRIALRGSGDDGFRVKIGTTTVIDAWAGGASTVERVVDIGPGTHLVTFEFFDRTEKAAARLEWRTG